MTVAHRAHGSKTPLYVEREGVLYEALVGPQVAEARKDIERLRLEEQIAALAGERRQEAADLLGELIDHRNIAHAEETEELVKQIAISIIAWGVPDLWRTIFVEHHGRYGWGDEGDYHPNAEWRFVFGADPGKETCAQFGITPTPDPSRSTAGVRS